MFLSWSVPHKRNTKQQSFQTGVQSENVRGYENWASGEPNDYNGEDESCLEVSKGKLKPTNNHRLLFSLKKKMQFSGFLQWVGTMTV